MTPADRPDPAPTPVRTCRISLKALAESLEESWDEMTAYLDLEAGEIVYVSADARRDLEEAWESLTDDLADASEDERRTALQQAISDLEHVRTEEEQILEADAVENGFGTRYVQLPGQDSRAGYRDMELFIDTEVADPRLRNRLDRAIRGRGAFRRFKDELLDAPVERERWFAFQQERLEARARDWLEDEGIQLVECAGPAS